MATLLHLQQSFPSTSTLPFLRNTHLVPASTISLRPLNKHLALKSLNVRFALTESEGSPKSVDQTDPKLEIQKSLQQLADSFNLPSDYFEKLPRDLRLDLNDAAFDLSNGPVIDEFGQEMGETLLNIGRAWELADTSTSATLVAKIPMLASSMTENVKSAFGKRLVSAGRRFKSMGQYGQGELQRIANAMITSGNLLAASPSAEISQEPKQEARMFKVMSTPLLFSNEKRKFEVLSFANRNKIKMDNFSFVPSYKKEKLMLVQVQFGELQVALTPEKAYIGAAIGLIFGILSWELSQGIQSIPESSLQYANDNALLLAKSLRGALLAMCYSSTVLSAFASLGLVLLGGQLKSKEK